jgi:hypothetical protein
MPDLMMARLHYPSLAIGAAAGCLLTMAFVIFVATMGVGD